MQVLGPSQPMAMYHWENDQEDFLVVAGEALLVIEGEERRSARGTSSMPGAHEARDRRRRGRPCVVVAVGSRAAPEDDWGGYSVDEAAQRPDAGHDQETSSADEAYARFPRSYPARYGDGWLP